MAQTMHLNNGTERGQRCPSTEEKEDSVAPYYVETPYGYQLDLDFLKYVDDIERGNTIKKLSIQRKPRTPRALALPRGSSQAEWTSTDSLSSSNSDDKQSPVSFSSRPLCPAPLTPTLSLSSDQAYSAEHRPLLPPQSPRITPRHNPQVEKTLMETRRRLEQERLLMQPLSEPPRRRLASFGGLGSNSSLSSYSGSIGTSQISPSTHQPLSANGHLSNGGEYNLYFPTSLGGSIRHSPLSSGMTTPVTNVSPLQLHQIREQMVIALKRLKELEEQVKTIPILQVKIAVLQEEKRQMAAQSKNPGGFRKRSFSVGSADQMENNNLIQKEMELHIKEPEAPEQKGERLDEFRRLAAEVQALEQTTRENTERDAQSNSCVQRQTHQKSIGTVTDENMNNLTNQQLSPEQSLRDVGVATDAKKTCSAAVGVTETMLGLTSDAEKEIELQQQSIDALKEKVYRLEVQLKETTHKMEMGKLKLELQAAGGSSKKKCDKGFTVKPEMYNVCVEAKVQVRSQGVGDCLKTAHTSQTVGVSCQPCLRSMGVGPEVSMDRWVVREKVQLNDQCVGRTVEMRHQEVCMERDVCEIGVNTEASMGVEDFESASTKDCRSVGSGDCSVDVVVSPVKTLISQGTEADLVTKVDSGTMASPESATRQTNTDSQGKSISTSMESIVLVDSCTDMALNTEDKHTNTAATETRTVAAGEGLVKDPPSPTRIRSVAVGTVTDVQSVNQSSSKTKECGVGALDISESYLVGLKTRNIACGPSQPPSPETVTSTTKENLECASVKAQDKSQDKSQEAAGLDHYIERVQKLLQEQQMLLAENYSELAEAFGQPQSQFNSINSQLVSTLSSINSVMKCGSAEDILKLQTDSLCLPSVGSEQLKGAEQTAGADPNSQHSISAEQKSRMDLQMSSALLGPSTLKSIMKKKDGQPESNGTKKNLQFVGVNGGYETTSSDESSSEDSSSSEEDGFGDSEGFENVEGKDKEESEAEGAEKVNEKDADASLETRERYELSEKMTAACGVLKTHLNDPKAVNAKDLRTCLNTIQHEWFRVSSQKAATPALVEDYLSGFRSVSAAVLQHVVNMADGNGNTALHYSVSHSNFLVVRMLLDADVCNVDQQNKAGYTPIMLAALAAVETPKDMMIVEELFSKGDVNARASQAGQTALMLAVSHGRMDMVRALLCHGAEVNVQDDEGSTALMCASEHGHVEIVKLLLAQAGCDATLSDSDESNALSIALEAGHKDIAVLLYAHVNFSKAQSPGTPRLGRRRPPALPAGGCLTRRACHKLSAAIGEGRPCLPPPAPQTRPTIMKKCLNYGGVFFIKFEN